MKKSFQQLILLLTLHLVSIIKGQTINQNATSSDSSSFANSSTFPTDQINDSTDLPDKTNWIKLFQLLTSQLTYDLIVYICLKINNGFVTLPLAIGFTGLTIGLIALIVAFHANWKVAKYEFKSAERRRREREIEEVHLKIYEQVIYGDRLFWTIN